MNSALLVGLVACLAILPCRALPGRAESTPLPGPSYLDTEGGPTDLVVEDLNGDGDPDLLLAGARSGVLVIHEGLGGGTFSIAQAFTVSGRPTRVAAGDLNRDQRPDLIWVDEMAGTLHWTYATGSSESPYTGGGIHLEGEETSGLLVIDLDQNGWLDVVVSVGGGDQIAVHLNDGAGALLPGNLRRVGDGPGPLLELTHPQSGEPRIVLTQQGALSANLAVYDGLPPILQQELSTGRPLSIEAFRWDDDALPDLLVVGQNGSRLQVHQARQDGSFDPIIDVPIEPGSVSATELDRIGELRRIVVGEFGRDRLTLFEGLPGETLSARQSWFVGRGFRQVVSADLDGGGKKEVLVPIPDEDRIALIQQNGAGLLAYPSIAVGVLPLEVRFVAEGTGHPARVAVLHDFAPTIRILEPDDGSLRQVQLASPGGDLSHLDWAYFNADAHPDLALLREGEGVVILLADGSGGFLEPSLLATGGLPQDFSHGDIDGDGFTDIAVADAQASATRLFYGDGTGAFTEGSSVANAVPPEVVVLVDLDLDDQADLLMLDGTNFLNIYYNDDGSYDTPVRPIVGSDPREIHLAEISQDPYPDIVVTTASSTGAYSTYIATAPRAYSLVALSEPFESGYSRSKLADLSGDGMPDLILTPLTVEGVAFRQGLGDGNFATQFPVISASLVLSIDTGDVDGDGWEDVILLDGFSHCLHILLQQPDPLVRVAGTLRALRSEDGVLLRVESAQPTRVVRERDGRSFSPREQSEGHWEVLDRSAQPVEEQYRLLDLEGNELDRASVAPLPASGTVVSLAPPSPNPGHETVQIRFQAPRGARVELRVVDARGRVVRHLSVVDGGAGWYQASWQGRDADDRSVAHGRYHLDLQVDGRRLSRSLIWMGN